MLVRELGGDAALCIGQASHAWLSGQLARAWADPQPEAVVLAAEQHDVGMAMWDLTPLLEPSTGRPVPFHRLPRPVHVALWEAAPRRLLTQSRHAALLVSLHGTGLYERFPAPPEDAWVVAPYLEGQRALQRRLAAGLGLDEATLRAQQALLARWDAMSLELCLRHDPAEPFVVDPWPFAPATLEVRCEGRRLDRRCATQQELHAALDAAAVEEIAFRLVPGA